MGRADYEERKQARIDRLSSAANRASTEASAQFKKSHDLVKDIPCGQPNIIGRPALPRLREKSWNALGKAVELDEKSDYYADKAASAESNTSIFSDDPEAINKLRDKLEALESKRDKIKASNKEAKKNGTAQAAWYALPYINRDIKSVKDRIAKLQMISQMPAELIEFDGGEIESDPITNRIKIIYDSKPSAETIEKLKSNGFKWAPSEGAWQRLRGYNALRAAYQICNIS